jgi:type IV secretory pathway VirB10-like protein
MMPMARQSLFATLAACAAGVLLAAGPAAAVLYKWIDANGRVSYSDQPPPGNVKAEIVGGAPPPPTAATATAPDAVREMANQELELKKRQAQRVADQKKAEKLRADAAAQQQACTQARAEIKIYEADELVITRINEKGEPVYLDETMRAKERERLGAQIRQHCAG